MRDNAARKLYAQVLLHDKVQQATLIAWLAGMSSEDSEDVLAEYAALMDDSETAAREAWVTYVRTQVTVLRLNHVSAFTIH